MTTALEIADAVAALINAATFDEPVTASRRATALLDRADLDGLSVTVVPRSDAATRVTRTTEIHDIAIDVGVVDPIPEGGDAEVFVSERCALTEAIRLALVGAAAGGAAYLRSAIDPIYSPDHLTQHGTFLSVIRLEYKK